MPEALCFLCFLSFVYLQTYPSVRYRGVLPAGVASPHQQRLVRAVAFRFARRRPVLPCIMSLHNSIHTKIQHNAIYIFIPAYF